MNQKGLQLVENFFCTFSIAPGLGATRGSEVAPPSSMDTLIGWKVMGIARYIDFQRFQKRLIH